MSQQQKEKVKGQEFLCKIRYKNDPPPLPFPPKLLNYEIDWTPLTSYKSTQWLSKQEFHYYPDKDLALPIQLIDLSAYEKEEIKIEKEDAFLLSLPHTEQVQESAKPMLSQHRPIVPWLRRTEYISQEGSKLIGRKQENLEFKRLQKKLDENPEFFQESKEAQISSIEKTFEHGKLKHPMKPDLKPVSVLDLFPDFEGWQRKFVHCYFDDDPAKKPLTKAKSQMTEEEKQQRLSTDRLLEKAFMEPRGASEEEQFILYYLPTSIADDEDEIQYETVRKYNFKLDKENEMEKFFLVKTEQGVFYHPILSKITLQKKRQKKRYLDTSEPTHKLIKKEMRSEEEIEAEQEELKEFFS